MHNAEKFLFFVYGGQAEGDIIQTDHYSLELDVVAEKSL